MTLHDILEGLDYLSDSANKSSIMMNNMVVLAIELFFIFAFRFVMLTQINQIPILHTPEEKKPRKRIIENHLGFEISLAVLIAWIVMMVVSSAQLNYVVNLVISPIVGTLGGITIDNIYILPRQHNSLYSTSDVFAHTKGTQSKESASSNPITININNSDDHSEETKEHHSVQSPDHIPDEVADAEDFNLQIIHALNGVKDIQFSHEQSIKSVEDTCVETLNQIEKLKESERLEKHISLKSQMYACLANGFVTPEEHDKIRAEYHIYRHLLGGNGDIQNLYEKYFSALGVHEDRRKNSCHDYKGQERRRNNNCEYGQFDTNYDETDTLNNTE